MRTTLIALVAVAACNHDAPHAGQGSSAQVSVPVATTEPTPGSDDEGPPSRTLPGAGLPGGVRGEPKAGAAQLSDLGVKATWPEDLRPRWLSSQALLVTLQRRPVMLAKVAAPTPGLVDGKASITSDNGQTTVACERTLRGATYHLEAKNLDVDAADQIAKLCAALE